MKREWAPLFSAVCNAKRMRKLPDNTCRLLFPLLVTQCDQHGRIADDADAIWAACWATFGEICSLQETVRALQALEDVGLIERHAKEGATWLQIPDWEDKAGKLGERLKRGQSKFPDPTPDSLVTNSRLQRDSVTPKGDTDKKRGEKSEKRVEGEKDAPAGRGGSGPAVEVEWWPKTFAEFPSLNTPEALTAFGKLLRTRKKRRDSAWDVDRLRGKLREFEHHGAAAWVSAVEKTIGNGWQGTFPPTGPQGVVGAQPTGLAAVESMLRRAT